MKKNLLRLILLLLLIPAAIYAGDDISKYDFYVDNTDYVNLYSNILFGLRDIFDLSYGSKEGSDYQYILKLMFLLGGVIILAKNSIMGGDLKNGLIEYGKYIVAVTSLLILIYSSGKAEIEVQSRTLAPICQTNGVLGEKINDFPKLLAYTYTTLNEVGYRLTQIVEQFFTPIGTTGLISAKLSETGGYMSATRANLRILSTDLSKISIGETLDENLTIVNPLSRSLPAFYTSCILVPFSADPNGNKYITDLFNSRDLINTVDLVENSAIQINGANPGDFKIKYNGEYYSCKEFWSYIHAGLDKAIADKNNTCFLVPEANNNLARFLTQSTDATVTNLQENMIQAGMIKSLEDAKSEAGSFVNGIAYASGKSRAEFNQNNISSGVYMSEMLPYFQETIRAMLYAFFPFVLIVGILPGGILVFKNYFSTLIWVELWTPTAAILNVIMTSSLAQKSQDILHSTGWANGDTHVVSATNNVDLLSANSTIAGVAGYLYLSVPALSFLILRGSAEIMGGVVTSAGAAMTKNMQTETTQRDQELVEKRKEAAIRTGKFDLSMAETASMEARVRGVEAGADLAYKSSQSNENLGNAQVFSSAEKISKVAAATEILGGTAAAAGEAAGAVGGINQGVATKTDKIKQQVTGVVNEDGNIDHKRIEEFSQAMGTSGASGDLSKEEQVRHIAKALGVNSNDSEGMKKVAEFTKNVEGLDSFANLKEKEQFWVAQHAIKNGKTGKTEIASEIAKVKGLQKSINVNTDKAVQQTISPNDQVRADTRKKVVDKQTELEKAKVITENQESRAKARAEEVKTLTEEQKAKKITVKEEAKEDARSKIVQTFTEAAKAEGMTEREEAAVKAFSAMTDKERVDFLKENNINEKDLGIGEGFNQAVNAMEKKGLLKANYNAKRVAKTKENDSRAKVVEHETTYGNKSPEKVGAMKGLKNLEDVSAIQEGMNQYDGDYEQAGIDQATSFVQGKKTAASEVQTGLDFLKSKEGWDKSIGIYMSSIDGALATASHLSTGARFAAAATAIRQLGTRGLYSEKITKLAIKKARDLDEKNGTNGRFLQETIKKLESIGALKTDKKTGKILSYRDTKKEARTADSATKRKIATEIMAAVKGGDLRGAFAGSQTTYAAGATEKSTTSFMSRAQSLGSILEKKIVSEKTAIVDLAIESQDNQQGKNMVATGGKAIFDGALAIFGQGKIKSMVGGAAKKFFKGGKKSKEEEIPTRTIGFDLN